MIAPPHKLQFAPPSMKRLIRSQEKMNNKWLVTKQNQPVTQCFVELQKYKCFSSVLRPNDSVVMIWKVYIPFKPWNSADTTILIGFIDNINHNVLLTSSIINPIELINNDNQRNLLLH